MNAPFSQNQHEILKNIEDYKNKIVACHSFQEKTYYIDLLYKERKKLDLCVFPSYCKFANQKNPILHSEILESKNIISSNLVKMAVEQAKNPTFQKLNLIWLEATGCSGNIISLLNAENPDVTFLLQELVTLKYNNSLMVSEGEAAFQQFIDTLDTEFVLVVEGAVSTKEDGRYNIIANYNGKRITAMEAVQMAGDKAKYIVAVGTCASYGGISAASPNPSGCLSVSQFLRKKVIRVPGCPSHPDWAIGTLAHLVAFGMPELDEDNRPVVFYGFTIHDRCQRRSFFDSGIFASKLGDPECMFLLGCRGPVTRTDCPIRQWNGYVNWPIKDNTPCIGCAAQGFPDSMEPFVHY